MSGKDVADACLRQASETFFSEQKERKRLHNKMYVFRTGYQSDKAYPNSNSSPRNFVTINSVTDCGTGGYFET